MTCAYCEKALDRPDHPLFQAQCRTCTVRALAQSPQFHQAERSMGVEAYQIALRNLLGPDWRASHAEVLAEAERIRTHWRKM